MHTRPSPNVFSDDIVPLGASAGVTAALTAVAIAVPYGAAVAAVLVGVFGAPVYRRIERRLAGRTPRAKVRFVAAVGAGSLASIAAIFGLLVFTFAHLQF